MVSFPFCNDKLTQFRFGEKVVTMGCGNRCVHIVFIRCNWIVPWLQIFQVIG